MSATFTQSYTVSVPRLSLLRVQVATALRRGADITDDHLESIRIGLAERWIGHVLIHGFDSKGECRAELALEIDWDRYQLALDVGHAVVGIDSSWRENVSPEIDETVKEFVDFCREKSLRREWRVRYSPIVTSSLRSHVDATLGFSTAPTFNWAGDGYSLDFKIRELQELAGWIRLVD